jgi:hypothetical protein
MTSAQSVSKNVELQEVHLLTCPNFDVSCLVIAGSHAARSRSRMQSSVVRSHQEYLAKANRCITVGSAVAACTNPDNLEWNRDSENAFGAAMISVGCWGQRPHPQTFSIACRRQCFGKSPLIETSLCTSHDRRDRRIDPD